MRIRRNTRKLLLSLSVTIGVFILIATFWIAPEVSKLHQSAHAPQSSSLSPQKDLPPPVAAAVAPSPAARNPAATHEATLDRASAAIQPSDHPAVERYFRFVAPPVASMELPPDRDGVIKRVRVVKTDFKYPLVRIVESVVPSANEPSGEKLINETAMIADHFMVKLRDGATEDHLARFAAKLGARIRGTIPGTDVFLVEFEAVDPTTYDRIIQAFRNEPGLIADANPDFLVKAR